VLGSGVRYIIQREYSETAGIMGFKTAAFAFGETFFSPHQAAKFLDLLLCFRSTAVPSPLMSAAFATEQHKDKQYRPDGGERIGLMPPPIAISVLSGDYTIPTTIVYSKPYILYIG